MIRVNEKIGITEKNIAKLLSLWKKDLARIKLNDDIYTNKAGLKLPYGKKLTITSAAATLGEGITISAPAEIDEATMKAFDELQGLFKKQTIGNHDLRLITGMCKLGRSYELAYMSDDESPVPKVTTYSALNAFVVFDNTVENNSILGVYVDTYIKDSKTIYRVNILDEANSYFTEVADENLKKFESQPFDTINDDKIKSTGKPHHMGRMPLTEVKNNDEEQADFEQLIALIKDRTELHNGNLKDFKDIAKNYLKGRNVEFAGKTDEEKAESRRKAAALQLIELETDGTDTNDDITILSKLENYASITEFGKDIDSKIYDLAMIPDLSADEFAGNQTGVALKLKLMPFKELIKTKNGELEKLYRRRLKMYAHALRLKGSSELDAADITITFNRNWTENEMELAQLIQSLVTTGLFSDEYLTNKMPDADYTEEQERLATEREEKAKHAPKQFGFDNSQGADYLSGFRALQGGRNENANQL